MNPAPHSTRPLTISLADFLRDADVAAIPRRRPAQLDRFLGGSQAWSILLPILDYAFLMGALALLTALWLQRPLGEFFQWEKLLSTNAYIAAILVTIVVGSGYHPKQYFRRLGFVAEFVLATVIGSAIGLFVIFALFPGSLRLSQESRAVLLFGSALFLVPGTAIRLLLARIRDVVAESRPFLVIGPSGQDESFTRNYHRTGLSNPLVFVDPADGSVFLGDTPPSDAVRHSFEGIILTVQLTDLPERVQDWLLEVHSENIPVHTLRGFYASMWRQSPVLDGRPDWIFDQDFRLAERSSYRVIKRLFDLVLSTVVLVLTLPILLLTAIAIKLDSPGPILFDQERVGRRQRGFRLYKFRTMHVREEPGAPYTAKRDPRVTRVGRILRRLRVDELPQLINVWLGEMSLIGPRPEWKVLVDIYEKEIPGYHLRHLVSPGITGWAQLNHAYGEGVEDTVEKLKFDLYYIQFYSPVLDLEIVLKTIVSIVLLKGR